MKIKVTMGQHSRDAALCRQQYAVISPDDTPIGTLNLSGCTGLLLYPLHAKSPSALAHVEAVTDKALYRECLRGALQIMLARMKRQDAAGLGLVLLGAGFSHMGSDADEHVTALADILRELHFADAEILDLRNRSRYAVGGARLDNDTELANVVACCVYFPKDCVLELLTGLPKEAAPTDTEALPQFRVQNADSSPLAATANPARGGCCTIL